MDTLGIEPRAFRMQSGCDTTTPCARWWPDRADIPNVATYDLDRSEYNTPRRLWPQRALSSCVCHDLIHHAIALQGFQAMLPQRESPWSIAWQSADAFRCQPNRAERLKPLVVVRFSILRECRWFRPTTLGKRITTLPVQSD